VVVDDARSIDQVVDLLPSSLGCLVFLTSRRRTPALRRPRPAPTPARTRQI